jgi:hypothetical protein
MQKTYLEVLLLFLLFSDTGTHFDFIRNRISLQELRYTPKSRILAKDTPLWGHNLPWPGGEFFNEVERKTTLGKGGENT